MIFHLQDLLILKYDMGIDVSSASEKKILWQKPDGTLGSWTADSVESLTKLVYQVHPGDLAEGNWITQAYAVVGGKKAYGSYYKFTIGKSLG
jgi:hypothetical protein